MDKLRENFEIKLRELMEDVKKMGGTVREMLEEMITVFERRDLSLADKVIKMDDIVDELNLSIETKGLQLIALQQPMGRDLRVIASAMRIITDIERMGDYAVDIVKFIKRYASEIKLPFEGEIPAIAKVVIKMLTETLEAFERRDLSQVQKMIADDDIVDASFKRIYGEVLGSIESNPKIASAAIHLLMMARYLERIADHITNVGERIYYIEIGELKELH